MNKKRIAIIGHFGGNKDFFDGQTVKTKVLYEELIKKNVYEITCVDTYYKKKNPIKLLIDSVHSLIKNKDIIVLLSGHGMRFYFPFLFLFSKFFNRRIYHDVIGGSLDNHIKKYPQFKKYLNAFRVNWVETEFFKKKLLEQGIMNCEVLPNFKRLELNRDMNDFTYSKTFRFCTFSRVTEEKGIEDAINSIRFINEQQKKYKCSLDIFGMIDKKYKMRFDTLMLESPTYISYKGVVPYFESLEAIKNYYALLFPTHWVGECFPGTIIDAFSAGLPVICSDWNSNSEIVKTNYNGMVYSGGVQELSEAILAMIEKEKNSIIAMRQNCIQTAVKYQPDKYVEKICDLINSDN